VNSDVDLFLEQFAAVNGTVHLRPPLEVVTELLDERGVKSFLAWDEVADLTGELGRLGYVRVDIGDLADRTDDYLRVSDVAVGITGADAALAESGSLVVRSGPGRMRLASLLPPVHVAILARGRIFRSLTHWMTAHGDQVAGVANTVFITGPSRTGDIEQIMTLGVHGPGEVHVVLVD